MLGCTHEDLIPGLQPICVPDIRNNLILEALPAVTINNRVLSLFFFFFLQSDLRVDKVTRVLGPDSKSTEINGFCIRPLLH